MINSHLMPPSIKNKRIPLPDATNGKHQPNELDKLLRKTRMKYLKQIVTKCDRLPNMEFKSVLEELESFYDILDQIQKEVAYFISFTFENRVPATV